MAKKKGGRSKRQSEREDGGILIGYTIDELIGREKRKMEAVLSGGESVPMEIYGYSCGEDIICDIHVNSDSVQRVTLSLKEVYGALSEIDSLEELEAFEKNYIKDLWGAAAQIPHVADMIELLRIHLAA